MKSNILKSPSHEGIWIPHKYPDDLNKIKLSLSEQPDHCTCGPAGVFNGLLLGGMISSISFWASIFKTHPEDRTSGDTLQEVLNSEPFGFEVSLAEKRSGELTKSFLSRMGDAISETGAFVLPCIYGGDHWVCGGLWKDGKLWTIDSYGEGINLEFNKYGPDEFDDLDWEDCVRLVRPGKWREQFLQWMPAREALLTRSSVFATRKGLFDSLNTALVMLQDGNYSYERLNLRLSKGTTLKVDYKEGDAYAFKKNEDFITINYLSGGELGEVVDVPQIAIRRSGFAGFDLE